MIGLSYPLVFQCSNCDNEIVVDRDAVQDSFRLSEPDLDSLDKVNAVLYQRGWMRDELDHYLFCPDCANIEAE